MMDIDSMIAVLEAAKAGKKIQINVSGKWTDLDANPSFGAPINSYRVKPEPREWDIAVHKRNNRPYPPDWLSHDSANSWEIVRVREVLE
jgi:hypothetical protein